MDVLRGVCGCSGKNVRAVYCREFYDGGALMLNDEATVVAGLLVGLNIIDCNMVLKDDDDLDRPVCGNIGLAAIHFAFVRLHNLLQYCYWRYVALVVVLWCPALSLSSLSVTTLR